MGDTTKKFCKILFDVLLQKGVKNIVCSPGSRNVPLLMAAASREEFKKYFVVDERSAAFLGLGISIVSREPVALICTSGTALLNYAPGVAEAYYQSRPLIVISADRPEQWIDQDDSQTLRQNGAIDNFVKKSYNIPAIGEDDIEMLWYVNRIANDALNTAFNGRPGPVHINVQLSEPLGYNIEKIPSKERVVKFISGDSIANKTIVADLAHQLSESKIMLVAGFGLPDSLLQKSVSDFCRKPNVTVMAETISNLHLNLLDYSVDSVLTAYNNEELDQLAPDIIISIGGSLVSRKLKEYLRRNSCRCQHWAIGYSHTTTDPFMSLSLRLETKSSLFFKNINSALRKFRISDDVSEYKEKWNSKRREAHIIKENFIKRCDWSELKAFDILLKSIPSDHNLFISNGTPIRYAQIISYPLPHASYCNRGVSGIDGNISTAIGGGLAFKGKTVLITGDLTMTYDIGALAVKNIPSDFKIIVIDNQGGGIFRFIPSTSELSLREEYLCQPPILPLKNLAEGYGWKYFECDSDNGLKNNLHNFFNERERCIMKIKCDGELSAEVLRTYMKLKV